MYHDVPEGLGLRKIAAEGALGLVQRWTPEQKNRLMGRGLIKPWAIGAAAGYYMNRLRQTGVSAAPMLDNSRDQTWRQNANAAIRGAMAPFAGIIRNAPNSVKSQIQGLAGNLGRLQRPQVLGTMVDNAMIDASTHIRPEDKQAVRNLREQQRRKWFKNGQYVGPKQGPYYDAARMANRTEPDVTGVF